MIHPLIDFMFDSAWDIAKQIISVVSSSNITLKKKLSLFRTLSVTLISVISMSLTKFLSQTISVIANVIISMNRITTNLYVFALKRVSAVLSKIRWE